MPVSFTCEKNREHSCDNKQGSKQLILEQKHWLRRQEVALGKENASCPKDKLEFNSFSSSLVRGLWQNKETKQPWASLLFIG